MHYRALIVGKSETGAIVCALGERTLAALTQGYCTIRIDYSAINYKDALAAAGHPGVARRLPLVPGIDAVGTVVESSVDEWKVGQAAMIAHADFGTSADGGFAEYAQVPAEWLVPLPGELRARDVAAQGTAAFTAAQCCDALLKHGVTADSGPVVVSGATGGVGIFAVQLLSKMGMHVVASTGKPDRADWLRHHGAREVVGRDALDDRSPRPLLSAQWAGGVDTVGGNCLSTMLRATRPRGCVAACGLVGGADLPITVFPFILRGVVLAGIDSANVARAERSRLWELLAGAWRLETRDLVREIALDALPQELENIRAGRIAGRVVVNLGNANHESGEMTIDRT